MQFTTRPSLAFAMGAHEAVQQVRKYTGEPYWRHPEAVSRLLIEECDWATPAMIAASDLHDVLEDTPVTLATIEQVFGKAVALHVDGLTERTYPGLNRAKRKAAEAVRLAACSRAVKTIKLCDLIDNTYSIAAHDPDFAKVYMHEKRFLLDHALIDGDTGLWLKADSIVREYFNKRLTA